MYVTLQNGTCSNSNRGIKFGTKYALPLIHDGKVGHFEKFYVVSDFSGLGIYIFISPDFAGILGFE